MTKKMQSDDDTDTTDSPLFKKSRTYLIHRQHGRGQLWKNNVSLDSVKSC